MKLDKTRELHLLCDCGHGSIDITYWPEDKFDKNSIYILSYSEMVFYSKQKGILGTIWHRIRLALHILIGKEYDLYEVALRADQFQDFISFVENHIKEQKEILDKN